MNPREEAWKNDLNLLDFIAQNPEAEELIKLAYQRGHELGYARGQLDYAEMTHEELKSVSRRVGIKT
jgi:hypothetical protein